MTSRERRAKALRDAKVADDSIVDDMASRWTRADGGYAWFDLADGRCMAPKRDDGGPDDPFSGLRLKGTTYYPMLTAHGLFKRFAALDPTEEQFLKFADEFGSLLIRGIAPEKKSDWMKAYRSLSHAVDLWEWIERGDRRFELIGGEPRETGRRKWILRRDGNYVASDFIEADSPKHAAKRMLQERINSGLAGNITVRVLWHEGRREFVNRIYPTTLLGFMWWQFARAFAGDVKIVECKTCRKPLERGESAFMATREFCSAACKQKDHREKVKQVRALRAKGMAVGRIAKRFNTDPKTIRHWLTKVK